MASEHVLQLRITQAAKDAERAIKNHDAAAYNKAVRAYEKNDALLRELEHARNDRAIAELEQSAKRIKNDRWLSFTAIEKSGVPVEVLQARGWELTDYGMRKARKLALIPKAEPQGKEP